jgi:hypothetical protein
MTQLATDIAVCLTIAALLGIVVGFLISKIYFCNIDITDQHKPHLIKDPERVADNLKQIYGIGINIEQTLNKHGVYYFSQIASWNKKNLLWIDKYLDVFKGRAVRDNWVGQAKKLAQGKHTPFSEKVKNGEITQYKE